MHKTLVIIGAGGQGRIVADVALNMNRYEHIVFLDEGNPDGECLGFPIVGRIDEAHKYLESAEFFVAIGNGEVRAKKMCELQEMNAKIATLIHPSAVIGTNVTIGKGTVIVAGAVINPCSSIGKGCIINTCTSVDHDCVVGDYVHVAAGARLCGTVRVGNFTWVGAGAVVRHGISICEKCMIGISAAVVKDITEAGTYVGVPARKH